MAQYKTPEDFGALGGLSDNHLALQKWLDYGGPLSIERHYASSQRLLIGNATSVNGIGMHLCGIQAHNTMREDLDLLENRNPSTDMPVDGYITLRDFSLLGASGQSIPIQDRPLGMVNFAGVEDFVFERMHFSGWRRHLVALNTCSKFRIEKCDFADWGSLTDPEDAGYALWFERAKYAQIVDNHFHDGEWAALLANGNFALIDNNLIERVKEAGIFQVPYQSVVSRNQIRHVIFRVVSAHGMEVGGIDVIYRDNIIDDTDLSGIYLTNPINVIVSGNILNNACQAYPKALPAGIPDQGPITYRNVDFGPEYLSRNVVITGNVIGNDNRKSACGITMYNWGGGKIDNLQIFGNIFGAPENWSCAPFYVAEDLRGKNCFTTYSF